MTTPHTALLGLGLTASSWFVFGNLALSQMGPMAVVQKRARLGVRPAQALQLWEHTYDTGIVHFALAAGAAVLGFAGALYAAPGALPSRARTLLVIAAAAFVAVPAWTMVVIMPINKRLKIALRAAEKRSGTPAAPEFSSQQEERDVFALMDRWRAVHALRTLIGSAGWAAAMAVVFLP